MKILVLSSEVWNDKINGNNVISNWFEGIDAEFANIYGSPEPPYNGCCFKYFQITDKMMIKSFLFGKKAGNSFEILNKNFMSETTVAEAEPKKLYKFLKSISGHGLRLIRELIWLFGKYDTDKLKAFLDEFEPDIIFSERMASCKMLRMEKIVSNLSDAPLVAFTGDDEYSLKQFKFSPFFWINRFMVRKRLREMVKKYKIYYTLSTEQKEYYENKFGCKCKILQKCGSFEDEYVLKQVHKPIRLIYAGKMYCNRWKVLAHMARELKKINQEQVKIILEIYTKDRLSNKQKRLLDDGKSSFIKGSVSQDELKKIYRESDIALHVESKDLKYRLETRFSFSTKIVDCIDSGCAVMAYCWNQHSGYTYLKREHAAICVSNKEELRTCLRKICNHPEIIIKYAKKSHECGQRNHERLVIQKMLLEDFSNIVGQNRKISGG